MSDPATPVDAALPVDEKVHDDVTAVEAEIIEKQQIGEDGWYRLIEKGDVAALADLGVAVDALPAEIAASPPFTMPYLVDGAEAGYEILTQQIGKDGFLYERSTNVGPEEYREHDWRRVYPTNYQLGDK